VWLLLPELLNETFLGWRGVMSPENNVELDLWLPRPVASGRRRRRDEFGYRYDNQFPLAILPCRNNLRIVAQQGVFTIHGRSCDPIPELLARKRASPSRMLARVDLLGLTREQAANELWQLGIRRSAIYPDLHNFVLQLKEQYRW
jgi:hypothetical protein